MKICIIGSGFTGILTAIAIKKNCPRAHVTLIDSPVEPKNAGFGESAPGEFIRWMIKILKISNADQPKWLSQFLTESRSTLKYSVEFKDFLHKNDSGFYSPMRLAPDHKIIFNNDMSDEEMPMSWLEPGNTAYKLYDLWYELYKAGKINYKDYQSHHDPFYWYNKGNKLNWVEDRFSNNYVSTHLNSFKTGEWLKKTYGNLIDTWVTGTVQDIKLTDSGSISTLLLDQGREINCNLYVDCTGFKRVLGHKLNLKWCTASAGIRHNTAVIIANGHRTTEDLKKSLITVTNATAMEYGWLFDITLLDRKSYGYVFNSADRTVDQALDEMVESSDSNTRLHDPLVVKWDPGSYENSWSKNYCLVGLASSFVDAFDASGILLQILQILQLIKFINDPVGSNYVPKDFSRFLLETQDSICERLDFSFGLAPRSSSNYWLRNHDIALQNNFKERLFDILSDYKHTPASMRDGTFRPWQDHFYYNTAIYYNIDMARRCRQSDPITLEIADKWFKSFSDINYLRAKQSPTQSEWFEQQGIDLSSLLM